MKFLHVLPHGPMTNACMHMWGELFPKRDQLQWSCSLVGKEIFNFFALEDDLGVLYLFLYPYMRVY